MKKTFPLKIPGKVDARVVEAVKNDVRKYVKRERRKPLPDGFTEWEFRCRAGADAANAMPCQLPELGPKIDEVANTGGAQVYIEILAQPGQRSGQEPV
ncbi:MAG: DUF6172 family protein [Opitutaceae bacterium]|nr:DUF6172 family protein [Opitutaceae bacterium]